MVSLSTQDHRYAKISIDIPASSPKLSTTTRLQPSVLHTLHTRAAQLQLKKATMVLEDLNAAQDSFSDNPYPSENDPYASSSPGPSFDASSFTHPIPIFGPLLGYSAASTRFKTEASLKFAELRIQRQLTSDESQALAGHLYYLEASKSYYHFVGIGFGTLRWYKTMHTNRYPMYQPKNVDPNKFMMIKGPMAQYARQGWRLALYMFFAGEMGRFFGDVFSQAGVATATRNDQRLSQLTADLGAAMSRTREQGMNGIKEEMSQRGEATHAAAITLSGRQPHRPLFNTQKPASSDNNDMSPTAGNESWSSPSDNSWGDYSQDTQSRNQPQEQPQARQSWDRMSAPQQSDDDASPTGGMFQDDVQNPSKPTGSSWDRLRRGGAPAPIQKRPSPGTPPYREQRENSTLGDSFTFAGSDEERAKGQEQAQKEFNERIERERQGQDFNDEGKRW